MLKLAHIASPLYKSDRNLHKIVTSLHGVRRVKRYQLQYIAL